MTRTIHTHAELALAVRNERGSMTKRAFLAETGLCNQTLNRLEGGYTKFRKKSLRMFERTFGWNLEPLDKHAERHQSESHLKRVETQKRNRHFKIQDVCPWPAPERVL